MSDLRELCERAARLQLLALSFLPPDERTGERVRSLGASLPSLGLAGWTPREHEYHRLMGASGCVPDCESDYAANALGGKGQMLADVAGFYRAFHFEPPRGIPFDHVSTELSFLAFLQLLEAAARHDDAADRIALCAAACGSFWREHFGTWASVFAARLAGAAGSGCYRLPAQTLAAWLADLPSTNRYDE